VRGREGRSGRGRARWEYFQAITTLNRGFVLLGMKFPRILL